MAFGPHWVFIAAAYLGVAVVIALLIAFVVASGRRVERRIERLEAESRPRVVREGER